MISRKIYMRLFALMMIAAVGLSIATGCGDDETTTAPEDDGNITMSIFAIVSSVGDTENVLGGFIEAGDTITGTYTYDPTTTDGNALATVGDYTHNASPFGIFLEINGLAFETDLSDVNFLMEIVNDHGTPPRDNYLLRSYSNEPVSFSVSVDHISWQLDDPDADAISSIGIPSEPPILADWTSIFGLTITGSLISNPMAAFTIRGHVSDISKVD